MTRTHDQETALMRKHLSTLALMAALVAVAFVSLPSEALAQYGHYYGHGYRYGYGHGYYGHGYGGYGPYGYGGTCPTTDPSGLRWVRSTCVMKRRST